MKLRKVAAAVLVTSACSTMYDPCFVPSSLVSDARVLAVRLDPPEALFDPYTFETGPVHVSALIAVPVLKTPIDIVLRARLCADTNDDGTCRSPGPWDFEETGDQFSLPSGDLHPTPGLIREAYAIDPLHGYGGARLTVEVEGETEAGAIVRATKRLVVNPHFDDTVPNHGLEVTGVVVHYPKGRDVTATGAKVINLNVGESVGLTPLIAPGPGGQVPDETYVVTDLSGRTVSLRERISYSFYVTAHAQYGPIGRPVQGADVADEPGPGDPVPPGGLVTLSPLNGADGRAYVVARDGRGGEAWFAFDFSTQDQRTCGIPGSGPTCADLEVGCL